MSWFANLFSSGAAKVIDSLGSAIDKLVTSDEEKLKMRAVLEKEMYNFQKDQINAVAAYDKEVSDRHKYDMRSDSWLAKNIRPLTLAFITVSFMLLIYLTVFLLDADKSAMVEKWVPLLENVLITIYAFYFGSRGIEKVQESRRK